MQVIAHNEDRYVLSLARGEELFETLRAWAVREDLSGVVFTGIGAADRLDLAYYDLTKKTYERHPIEEEVEILSLIGNIAILNGETALHIHGTFGRRDLSAFGGHLFGLRISGACELHLAAMPVMGRAFDETTGLNLLCPVSPHKS